MAGLTKSIRLLSLLLFLHANQGTSLAAEHQASIDEEFFTQSVRPTAPPPLRRICEVKYGFEIENKSYRYLKTKSDQTSVTVHSGTRTGRDGSNLYLSDSPSQEEMDRAGCALAESNWRSECEFKASSSGLRAFGFVGLLPKIIILTGKPATCEKVGNCECRP